MAVVKIVYFKTDSVGQWVHVHSGPYEMNIYPGKTSDR